MSKLSARRKPDNPLRLADLCVGSQAVSVCPRVSQLCGSDGLACSSNGYGMNIYSTPS